jgi:hypothetical protein
MAGLRPGHPRLPCSQDVDARHKAGHDELKITNDKKERML